MMDILQTIKTYIESKTTSNDECYEMLINGTYRTDKSSHSNLEEPIMVERFNPWENK